MKKIQEIAASFFVVAVMILSIISIMGVWEIFDHDVIGKSFQSLGLLAVVAIIVLVAGHFIEARSTTSETSIPGVPNPIWRSLRSVTLTILIASVSLLALTGILAIWEVIKDKDILFKSLSSLGILTFGSFIIVMTCLDREGKFAKTSKSMSWGSIIGILVVLYLIFSFSRLFWY